MDKYQEIKNLADEISYAAKTKADFYSLYLKAQRLANLAIDTYRNQILSK
jgi:hypothetical protein